MRRRQLVGGLLLLLLGFGLGVATDYYWPATQSGAAAKRKLDHHNWAEAVRLPGSYVMPVHGLLFRGGETTVGNLFGDGFSAYVVRIEPGDLRWFVENLAAELPGWSKGAFYKGDMEAYDWVMEWMKPDERTRLAQVVDLASLIKKPGILHRAEVQRNSSNSISNVNLWIIDPERSIIVFLNSDT